MNLAAPPSIRCRTEGFAGYAVKFSPFYADRLAVASAQNFGLVGNGRLHLLSQNPASGLQVDKFFDTQDGLYDLAWSEVHENQLATGSGDGSVKLWDLTLNDFPVRKWHEHAREVFCVDWNNLRKEFFATCSWDQTIKIWTPERASSIATIQAHTACVYNAIFSPHEPDTLASCSSDGYLKVWDLKVPSSPTKPGRPQLSLAVHPTEVLSLDWNKYQPNMVATSSVDRSIKIHDLRMASSSPHPSDRATLATLLGHEYAVRKVAFSPHSPTLLASASYDMTARIWDVDVSGGGGGPNGSGAAVIARKIYDLHSEFVVGLAWSLYEQGVVATSSWDQETHLWMC